MPTHQCKSLNLNIPNTHTYVHVTKVKDHLVCSPDILWSQFIKHHLDQVWPELLQHVFSSQDILQRIVLTQRNGYYIQKYYLFCSQRIFDLFGVQICSVLNVFYCIIQYTQPYISKVKNDPEAMYTVINIILDRLF